MIQELTEEYRDDQSGESTTLSEEDSTFVIGVLTQIAGSSNFEDLKTLSVLTEDSRLCSIEKVVFDDVNASQEAADLWKDDDDVIYTLASSRISHAVAKQLKLTMLSTQYWHAKKDPDLQPWAQQENIVERIKNILNDYDPSSIFNEFLQNAEDAGASTFVLKLDQRSFGTSTILSPEMATCQGPALIIYNNAEFTKEDFRALCNLGVGNKRKQITTNDKEADCAEVPFH